MADVDYGALAATHGGSVDYGALAAMHGAIPEAPQKTGLTPATIGQRVAQAAAPVGAAIRTLQGPLEEIATRPGATEAIANKLGTAGKVASVATGLGIAAKDLYEGHPLDAAKHALEGVTPTAIPLAYKALKKYAGEELPNMAGGLTKVFGTGARLAKIIGDAAPMLGAFGAEGEALQQLNSPESMLALAKHSTPEERVKLADYLKSRDAATAAEVLKLNVVEPDKDVASVKALIDSGAPPGAAVKQVAGENPSRFGSLMTLYLRSRQVK